MAKMTILEGNSNNKDNLRAYMVKGEKGDPGVSPTFETRRTARGGIIEITDVEGTEELELYDGESYEIPTNGVIGWASEDTIPGGYEEINCGKVPTFFNSVAEMKAGTLSVGDIVQTLGFYEANDGGGAKYLIIANVQNADGYFTHELDNGLYADIIFENNKVNIRQIGARSQGANATKYDIKNYIDAYMSKLDRLLYRIRLYIPSGVWYTSGNTLARLNGFDIYGDTGFGIDRADGTIITSLNDNQDNVLSVGNNEISTKNWNLENIILSSADFVYDSTSNCLRYSTVKTITKEVMNLLYATFGVTNNLFFLFISGRALQMSSCWELYFGLLNFRHIHAINSSIWNFAKTDTTLLESANTSANYFEKIMFEALDGHLINCENDCRVTNNHFGTINFEDYPLNGYGKEYTTFTDTILRTWDEDSATHMGIFNLEAGSSLVSNVIDSIEMNNVSYRYFTVNNVNYVYDTIFNFAGANANAMLNLNNIAISGMNKDLHIIRQLEPNYPFHRSKICIGKITNNSLKKFDFMVQGFEGIECEGNLFAYTAANLLGNDFTPFYKIMERNSAGHGLLYYDYNSQNDLRLCVKPNSGTSATVRKFAEIVLGGLNILMRAKIPSGETYTLTIIDVAGNLYDNINLVGTGGFNKYTIHLSSNLAVGNLTRFFTASSNTGSEILIDWIKYI